MASAKRFWGWVRFFITIALGLTLCGVASAQPSEQDTDAVYELGARSAYDCEFLSIQAVSIARQVGGLSAEHARWIGQNVQARCLSVLDSNDEWGPLGTNPETDY